MAPPPPPPPGEVNSKSMNSVISWKALCWAPVPTSPVSWLSAFWICWGEKLKMFWKPAGKLPPPSTNASIAPATSRSLIVAPGGNSGVSTAKFMVRNTSFAS